MSGGLIVVILLTAVAALVFPVWIRRRPTSPFAVRAIERRVVDVGGTRQIELELADGRLYRSEYGFVWYHFPSGERVDVMFCGVLDDESSRIQNIDRWAHADEKELGP